MKKRIPTTVLLATYRNHIIHCTVYSAILAYVIYASCFSEGDVGSIRIGTFWCTIGYFLISALLIFLLYGEITYIMKRIGLPPGDSGMPFVGHLFPQFSNPEKFIVGHEKRYGSMNTMNLLMLPVVMLSDDEDVDWMLAQERKGNVKAYFLDFLQDLLGRESIMLKSGSEHKRLRKIFEPAFTPKAVQSYASTMDAVIQELMKEWSDKGDFMPPSAWAFLALRIFFICSFGEVNEDLLTELIRLFEGWVKGFNSPIPIAYPGSTLQKAYVFRDKLGDILKLMIQDFKAKNPPDSKEANDSVLGRLCYSVDEDGNPPTEEQLIANLRFFLSAGYDTTKASFGAISHYVTRHPRVYQLLVDEAKNFGDHLDYDDLKNKAPILNAVMAETWRLEPPLNSHAAMTKKKLHYKGYTFPEGVVLCMNIQGHNALNESRFPGAKEFRIERWLPEDHPLYNAKLATGIDYNVMSSKYRTFNALINYFPFHFIHTNASLHTLHTPLHRYTPWSTTCFLVM